MRKADMYYEQIIQQNEKLKAFDEAAKNLKKDTSLYDLMSKITDPKDINDIDDFNKAFYDIEDTPVYSIASKYLQIYFPGIPFLNELLTDDLKYLVYIDISYMKYRYMWIYAMFNIYKHLISAMADQLMQFEAPGNLEISAYQDTDNDKHIIILLNDRQSDIMYNDKCVINPFKTVIEYPRLYDLQNVSDDIIAITSRVQQIGTVFEKVVSNFMIEKPTGKNKNGFYFVNPENKQKVSIPENATIAFNYSSSYRANNEPETLKKVDMLLERSFEGGFTEPDSIIISTNPKKIALDNTHHQIQNGFRSYIINGKEFKGRHSKKVEPFEIIAFTKESMEGDK